MFRHLFLLAVTLAFLAACAISPADSTALPPATTKPTFPLAATPPAAESDTSFLGIAWDAPEIFAPGLIASQQQNASIPGATVYHMTLTIDESLTLVHGQAEIRYTNRESVPLNEIGLRLYPNIIGGKTDILQVTLNRQVTEPTYSLANSLMTVKLPAALPVGENIVIWVDFTARVPTDANKNYGVLAAQDGVLTLAHAYPMVAVYDETGWNAEIPSELGDLTYADASFYIVQVTAPKKVTLVATGREISAGNTDTAQVVTFALGPARDFMLAAVSGYQKFSQDEGDITVNCYVPEKFVRTAPTALETARVALRTFSQRYSPYPYTEFDIIATPTFALGVEYPGLTAIAANLFDGSNTTFSTPVMVMLESTLTHEIGHQWFYNLVGNDQLDQPWLDESLAQFATWQYFDDRYGAPGGDGYRASLEGRWARVEKQEIPVGRPVAAYVGPEYSAIVYGRGALFFFALRDEIGQPAFDDFLKNYVRDFSWEIATTPQIKAAAESSCGCQLDDLFAKWVDG